FPNLLFPIPHTCPITTIALTTLSFICSSCPPFLCIVCPKYLNFFTSSILFPIHLQSTLLLLPPPFLILIIFVLSMFNSSPFLSTYPSSLSNNFSYSLHPLPSTLYHPHTSTLSPLLPSPPHLTLPISSSKSAIMMLNNKGLSGHPCLIPLAVQKLSPNSHPPPALTLLFVSLIISPTLSTNPSLTPLLLNASTNIPLSTESNAALKFTNNAINFPPFFLTCLFTK
ncbi:hypothetical protein ALC57_15391, partial [Trachymyrmex cornetzi]